MRLRDSSAGVCATGILAVAPFAASAQPRGRRVASRRPVWSWRRPARQQRTWTRSAGQNGSASNHQTTPFLHVRRIMPNDDPYVVDSGKIRDPPHSVLGQLRYLGPGFVLSASIVGSGELIATTTLGARAGMVTLWVILVSCAVKVALQLEFGRHTIQTGEPVMQLFNALPGPRLGRANWTVWTWFLLQPAKILQVGGIVGSVAMILHLVVPGVTVATWAWLAAMVVALLVFWERYAFIERFSLLLMAAFTLLTFASVGFLQCTPYAHDVGRTCRRACSSSYPRRQWCLRSAPSA